MEKDILGNNIEETDLEGFETDTSDNQPDEQVAETAQEESEDKYKDIVDQIESGKEIELESEDVKPLSWKEKKQNRWKEHKERTQREQQARIEAERRAELAERELQVLRQTYQQQQQPPGIPQNQDSASREEDELYDQQSRLYELYNRKAEAGNVTAEETAKFQKEVRNINSKIIEAAARRVVSQQPQQDVGHQALYAQLRMQYPEVYADERASRYAQGLFQVRVSEGAPNNIDTVRNCLSAAAKRFKYASAASEADDGTKRRFSGPKRGFNGKSSSTPKVVITKDILKIVNATYPNIEDEGERLKKWLKVHGADFAESMKNEQP